MPRIVRKSRERLIEEAYEARLAERERVIRLLAEQVEYLRAQLNMPTATVSMAAQPPELDFRDLPEEMQLETTPSDDEEELLAMRQAGVIDEVEYQTALERLKNASPDDIIE